MVQRTEQPPQHHHCRDAEHHFRHQLGVSQTVQREQVVQDAQRRNLQHDLAHDGKDQGIFAEPTGLEHPHRQEINAEEGQPQAEALQKAGAIGDDALVFHKHADEPAGRLVAEDRRQHHEGARDLDAEQYRPAHPLAVSAGIVVPHQGLDPLGKAGGDIPGHLIDLLGDAHGGHRIRPEGRGKVVEQGHAGHVEQVLDGGRNPHLQHPHHDGAAEAELARVDADAGGVPPQIQQDKEVQAGHTVGQEGGEAGAGRPHPKAPGHDEDRIQHNVQQTATHGADAGVHGGAFGPHQVGHDDIQDRRRRPAGHRPEQIVSRRLEGGGVRPQHAEQRRGSQGIPHRKQHCTDQRTVKPESRAARHRVLVLQPQRTAHHAGTADAEQVVDGVEGQQQRRRQRHAGALDRVVEHPHKQGIGQVVQHHHQRTEDGGHRQGHHGAGDRAFLKQGETGLFHFSYTFHTQRRPAVRKDRRAAPVPAGKRPQRGILLLA